MFNGNRVYETTDCGNILRRLLQRARDNVDSALDIDIDTNINMNPCANYGLLLWLWHSSHREPWQRLDNKLWK
jgi:hypothetical protein